MSKPQNKMVMPIDRGGPDDGIPINAAVETVLLPDGSSVNKIQIEMSQAPVPDRRYLADTVWVAAGADLVQLMFGQLRIDGTELRSLVIACLTPRDVVEFLKNSANFSATVRRYFAQSGFTGSELHPMVSEPAQTVSMFANVIAAAFAGPQATLDFYHASPRALHRINQTRGSKLGLEPVVRVILPTALLLPLLEALEQMQSTFPINEVVTS